MWHPRGVSRDAFAADVARLVALFAGLAQAQRVRLRLDMVTGDACRRWHRDCVPLRLLCTYWGPGTQWLPPADGAEVLTWPGQPHEGGIVHRSPRIAGTGVARLVLVLDAAWPAPKERR